MLGVGGIAFVFCQPRMRALIALLSIFVAAFEVEIGIGLNLPSLLAILSGIMLFVGKIDITSRCSRLFAGRLIIFLLWAFGVWLVGYIELTGADNAQHGWTRGSSIKPIVQLIRALLYIPFVCVVADGLRSREDFHWFVTWWARIAVASALLCVGQVAAHKATGTTLGIYNAHKGGFRTAQTRIAGVKILRASGLAGEPKSQGMAMAISLCMLIGAWDRRVLIMSGRRHLASIFLVGLALVSTFSTGAICMIPFLLALVLVDSYGTRARNVGMAVVALVVIMALCFPNVARSMWEVRIQKIVSLVTELHGTGWGMDKERPAIIYLLDHPNNALTGVGIGIGPYHFDSLITVPEFRGKYVDPNSGVLWSLYGFGLVGSCLAVAALLPEIAGRELHESSRFLVALLLRFTLIYFLVYTPLWWLMIAVGLACSTAVQQAAQLKSLPFGRQTALQELTHAA